MKICLLLTYPETHLREIHAREPVLASLSFKEQVSTLMDEIPEATTLWAPALQKSGHDVRVVIANDEPSQTQWAREKLGTNWKPEGPWMHHLVIEQLKKIKPEVLLITDLTTFDGSFAMRVHDRVPCIVGWTSQLLPDRVRLRGFDLVVSPHDTCVRQATELGASEARMLRPGFPRSIAEAVFQTPICTDVVCFARWPVNDLESQRHLTALAAASRRPNNGFSLGLYLDAPADAVLPEPIREIKRAPLHGLARYRAMTSARLIFADPSGAGDGLGTSLAIHEGAGLGVAVLSRETFAAASAFTLDRETFGYRDCDDLITKLDSLLVLQNAPQLEQAGRAAQERCLTEHSMEILSGELASLLAPRKRRGESRRLKLRRKLGF